MSKAKKKATSLALALCMALALFAGLGLGLPLRARAAEIINLASPASVPGATYAADGAATGVDLFTLTAADEFTLAGLPAKPTRILVTAAASGATLIGGGASDVKDNLHIVVEGGGTLTVSNLHLTAPDPGSGDYHGIEFSVGGTLRFAGRNALTGGRNGAGIFAGGDLLIEGLAAADALAAAGFSTTGWSGRGISVVGNLTLQGLGAITAAGGLQTDGSDSSNGIWVSGSLVVDGPQVMAESPTTTGAAAPSVVVNGSGHSLQVLAGGLAATGGDGAPGGVGIRADNATDVTVSAPLTATGGSGSSGGRGLIAPLATVQANAALTATGGGGTGSIAGSGLECSGLVVAQGVTVTAASGLPNSGINQAGLVAGSGGVQLAGTLRAAGQGILPAVRLNSGGTIAFTGMAARLELADGATVASSAALPLDKSAVANSQWNVAPAAQLTTGAITDNNIQVTPLAGSLASPGVVVTLAPTTPPSITGPTSMALTAGYGATSSSAFTLGGSPAPTVAKTSGNAAITWNAAAQTLDIAAGLAAGTYPVVLTATNGTAPDATLTFTLTVAAAGQQNNGRQNGADTPQGPGSPQTGDGSSLPLWAACGLLGLAGLALCGAAARKKRRGESGQTPPA